MPLITGPSGSSAAVPRASFALGASGTPKSMTDRSPLLNERCLEKGTIVFKPRRC